MPSVYIDRDNLNQFAMLLIAEFICI